MQLCFDAACSLPSSLEVAVCAVGFQALYLVLWWPNLIEPYVLGASCMHLLETALTTAGTHAVLLQVHDQTLERGNRALLANIALGLPVRVFRRNDDRGGATNSVIFYDGLYDVVRAASLGPDDEQHGPESKQQRAAVLDLLTDINCWCCCQDRSLTAFGCSQPSQLFEAADCQRKQLLGLPLCAGTDCVALCWAGCCQVSWVKTRGNQGLVVYIFGLRRRLGQAASLSKPVSSGSSSSCVMWSE
jgi:hypothetical protein